MLRGSSQRFRRGTATTEDTETHRETQRKSERRKERHPSSLFFSVFLCAHFPSPCTSVHLCASVVRSLYRTATTCRSGTSRLETCGLVACPRHGHEPVRS